MKQLLSTAVLFTAFALITASCKKDHSVLPKKGFTRLNNTVTDTPWVKGSSEITDTPWLSNSTVPADTPYVKN